MSVPVPLRIVSLPARNVADARAEIEVAARAGADAAEVRLDLWSEEERRRSRALFPSPLPLVATLRSRAEGGEGPNDAGTREAILRRLEDEPFDFLDLEAERDRRLLPEPDATDPHRPRFIVSTHAGGTPDGETLRNQLDESLPLGAIRKIVFPASLQVAVDRCETVLSGRSLGRAIVHTVGPSGALYRVGAGRLGLHGVYCAPADDRGAPGAPLEPSQLPVDRMAPYLDAGERGAAFAIVGHPVGHSASPALHARWMKAERRPGVYVTLEPISPEEFTDVIPRLGRFGFRGVNVTHPFKALALGLAAQVADSAETCGAANILTFGSGGLEADNTDLPAVERRFRELRSSGRWDGASVLVLGTGGAARAALRAAERLAVPATVKGRDPEATRSVAREFGARWDTPSDGATASLVVHATTVGRSPATSLEMRWEDRLVPGSYVLDFVYSPLNREIERGARSHGAEYEDGWRLLVYQAAESYRRWWGAPPDEDLVNASFTSGNSCAA